MQQLKKIKVWYLGSSFLMAVVFGTALRIQFSGKVWDNADLNYIKPLSVENVLVSIFLIPIFYILFLGIGKAICHMKEEKISNEERNLTNHIKREQRIENIKFSLIMGGVILIVWLPWYLSCYPGGIFADIMVTFRQIFSGDVLNNKHTVLYNLIWYVLIKIGQALGRDLIWVCGFMMQIQMIVLALFIIYFGIWFFKHKISKKIILMAEIFLIFFPTIPMMGVSIWKDTFFSVALAWHTLAFADLFFAIKKEMILYTNIIAVLISLFGVCFLRNNGIYIIVGEVMVLFLITVKKYWKKKYWQVPIGIMILGIIITLTIQGPIYDAVKVTKTDSAESLGIPWQQISRVVVEEEELTKKQIEKIDKFVPLEGIKEWYRPCLVDGVKWYAGMDLVYMSENIKEFLVLWAEILVNNLDVYIDAYLLATAGFWNPFVKGLDGYVQIIPWPGNDYGIENIDLFEKIFEFSIRENLYSISIIKISSAWFFWLLFISMIVSIQEFGVQKSILYMPPLLLWATIMIATPIAVSMRYVFVLVLLLPYAFIMPIILKKEEIESRLLS